MGSVEKQGGEEWDKWQESEVDGRKGGVNWRRVEQREIYWVG